MPPARSPRPVQWPPQRAAPPSGTWRRGQRVPTTAGPTSAGALLDAEAYRPPACSNQSRPFVALPGTEAANPDGSALEEPRGQNHHFCTVRGSDLPKGRSISAPPAVATALRPCPERPTARVRLRLDFSAMCPATVSGPAQLRRLAAQPGVQLTVLASVFGAVCTAVIAWSPFATFGFRSPSLHLVLDTADACVALLVAYLVHARFLRRHRWQDALLAQGLVLLAVASSGLGRALTSLPDVRAGTLDVWLPLAARVGGATLIMVAALADGRPARTAGWLRRSWAAPAALVALATAVIWAARASLPVAVGIQTVPTTPEQPLVTSHAALLGAQVFSGLCFFVASIAFAVQSTHREDELLRWLGPACSLAAFARVHYVLFPSLYTDWLYTGDLLRTGCYLLFLVGTGRELRQYWTAQANAAVLEDRRRLARELHDGVVQELAYIRGEAHRLPADEPVGERIIAASDRGLDEARAAIHALGRPAEEPLGFVIHRTAGELAERYQVNLEV